MTTAYVSHPDCLRHEMAQGHPECPARVSAIEDRLIGLRLFDFLRHYDAPKADRADLCRVHDPAHVEALIAASPAEGLVRVDPDTYMNPHTIDAALRAAGAVVLATGLVIGGHAGNAFCNVRPPGHHATRREAMGFCFFNNIAVGVASVLERHGLERVAILDFDVHHGNGTEDIFEDDRRVLVCSTYQHPLFPYTGRDTVDGHLINVPLAPGTAGRDFRARVEASWLPQLESFDPQMIFVSAGFDAHRADDMASLNLIESDYAWVTRLAMDVADRHAGGRLVSVLEGGYVLDALARSAAAHVRTLLRV